MPVKFKRKFIVLYIIYKKSYCVNDTHCFMTSLKCDKTNLKKYGRYGNGIMRIFMIWRHNKVHIVSIY